MALSSPSNFLALRLVGGGLGLALACSPKPPSAATVAPVAPGPSVEDYETWVDAWFERYAQLWPVTATSLGVHSHDGQWPDMSEEGRELQRNWVAAQLRKAERMAAAPLSLDQRVDLEILQSQLQVMRFEDEVAATWARNPLAWSYLVGGGLDGLINRNYAPVEQRALAVAERLEGLPQLLVQAATAMAEPAAIQGPQARVAKQQLAGLRSLIRVEIPKSTAEASEATQQRIAKASRPALAALDAYEALLLSDEKLAAAKGEWRLGAEAFQEKLGYTLGEAVDAAALHQRARRTHAQVRRRMETLAFELYLPLFGRRPPASADELGRARIVREVLDELAKIHPAPAELRDACAANLATIEAFVSAKKILPLDPEESLEVIWTPPHQRGVAIAGLDPAPPLDPAADLESFYLVQPLPDSWDAAVKASFLREYNHFMLEILSIHEAIPGHFVQLYYAKREPSKVRRAFGNGPFIEGWAVYTEAVMVDAGYSGVDPTVGRERPPEISERLWALAGDPELRAKAIALHGAKFYLRTVTNAILDYEIHAGELDEAGAMQLMVERAYQQEGEARGKWIRAQVSSTQLSTYFVGASAWFDLREAAQGEAGFDMSAWHAAALSHGAPPMPALARLLAAPPAEAAAATPAP